MGLSAAWTHFLLGRIWYEWDDLAAAEEHFHAVIDRRDQAHFLPLQGACLVSPSRWRRRVGPISRTPTC